jgi:hypothetical protein
MNAMKTRPVRFLLCVGIAMSCACQRGAPPVGTEVGTPAESHSGVTLDAAAVAKLGIVVTPAAASVYAPEAVGYGVVLAPDTIAQAVADVATAEASLRQSRAALARATSLTDTPGAFSTELLDSAQRQLTTDAAALALARRKLSATFGQNPVLPSGKGAANLEAVASGTAKLVRATFPLGTLRGPAPHSLRIARPDPDAKGESWQSQQVWSAPADSALPGRSFFALLDGADLSAGERLDVRASTPGGVTGVLVPHSAIVMSQSQYWCFVEGEPGHFARVAIDPGRPMQDGYFVTKGVDTGTPIVTAGAGLLLARETNASTEAE